MISGLNESVEPDEISSHTNVYTTPLGMDERLVDSSKRASNDVVSLLRDEVVKERVYGSIVFWSLCFILLSSMLFAITEFVYFLVGGINFFRYLAIVYVSLRSFLFICFFLPYAIYSSDIDTVTNKEDKKVLDFYRSQPYYRNSPTWFSDPGYLYDTRDIRNRRTVPSMLFYVSFVTAITLFLYGRFLHLSSSATGADTSGFSPIDSTSVGDSDFTLRFYAYLLPAIGGIIALHISEIYVIIVSLHHLYRRAAIYPYDSPAKTY